jgi:A/G-specific adenine glycosylase
LIAWQRREGRHDLPWQGSRDAYRVWVSEVMLQQTQVAAVIGYYQRFLAAFPTVEALAAASLERVLALWSGLGYYSRARNLHACARRVVADFSGVFPSAPEILETLPGIGRSTASAIAVFSAGIRAPILDGNVKRVLSRSFGIEGYPGEKAVHDRLWQLAERLLPASQIEAYTQGLMDFGATVCTPRKPRCEVCFFKHRCVAFGQGRIDELPARKAARHYPERHVVMLVLHHTGAVLLQKRPAPGIWGGLWCLPEWPKDTGGAAALAFARDHGRIASVATLASFAHGFTHFRLWVEVLAVDLAAPLRSGTNPGELWLDLADASGAALPAPIKRLLLGLLRASPLHAGEVLKT